MRAKYFRDADDSLHETIGAVDLARITHSIDEHIADEIQRTGFRLRAKILGLRPVR